MVGDSADYPEPGSQGFQDLIFVGHHSLDGKGEYTDVWVHGDHAYVGSFNSGVFVLDVTDPERPEVISRLHPSPNTSNNDIKVSHLETDHFSGDVAVATEEPAIPDREGGKGVAIWDVTDPAEPRLLSRVNLGGSGVHNAYIQGQYVYLAAAWDGLGVLDISNPRSPVVVATWSGGTLLHDAWASEDGTRLYLSYTYDGLVIMNVTDPANPEEMGRLPYGTAPFTHSAVPNPGKDLVIVTDEVFGCGSSGFMRIIDISDESSPREAGTFKIPETDQCVEEGGLWTAHNPFLMGDLVYLSWYSAGVLTVNISDPSYPREVARFIPPTTFPLGELTENQGVFGIYVLDGRVFASDMRGGLYVLEHGPLRPHVIVDKANPSGDRVDVGSSQEVGFHISLWWPDGTISSVEGGYVALNGTPYPVNASGWASFDLSYDSVGRTTLEVDGVSINGVTRFQRLEGRASIVWDRVSIQLQVDNDRIDVGSNASIAWSGLYEYDGEPFNGTIALNDVTAKSTVGIYSYTVESIYDRAYGLSAFRSNLVSVIFDMVDVQLSVTDDRIDVGSTAEMSVEATYLYDNTPFDGKVILNNSLTQREVGGFAYDIAKIEGSTHGITVFQTNPVSVIFDRVEITLTPGRFEVGKSAEIGWDGRYAYDGAAFTGEATLSDDTSKSEIGTYIYTVAGISDPRFGLTVFRTNIVEVIFDRIIMVQDVDTVTPGRVTVRVGLEFESDGERVEDALVTVDDVRAVKVGGGAYGVTLADWGLAVTLSIRVERSGFSDLQIEATSYAYGNLGVEFGIPAVILLLAYILIRRRRAGFEWV